MPKRLKERQTVWQTTHTNTYTHTTITHTRINTQGEGALMTNGTCCSRAVS